MGTIHLTPPRKYCAVHKAILQLHLMLMKLWCSYGESPPPGVQRCEPPSSGGRTLQEH